MLNTASRLRDERGATFVMAILGLVVMLILGTSFIGRTINALYTAKNARDDMSAVSLAESGVDMVICMLYEDYGSIGSQLQSSGQYQKTFTMPRGTCYVHVSTNYGGVADALRIQATGTTSHNVQAQVQVIAKAMTDVSRVFRGAIFSNSPMTLNGAGSVIPDESGDGGDIYANGDITFDGTSFTMSNTGHIYTTGTTNWVPPQVPGTNVYQNIAPIPMPVIDLNWYQANATTVINGNLSINGGEFDLDGITYVTGDVKLAGSYRGRGIIVAAGKIRVTGNVEAITGEEGSDDFALVLMSPRSVSIVGGATVEGLVYAHNVDADITLSGNPYIKGAICADVVTSNGAITVEYDDVWGDLGLPGEDKPQYQQVSWERVY
ncbi:MAG: pilus assembly PilX N-terminal domain-containing protein [Armatimonadota bacterium]|nr:MAG: pilus assembly PilX N-terminal domain-containing protein [Armatimonadota bacterium]